MTQDTTNERDLLPVTREYRKTATIRASQWHKMGDHPAVLDVLNPVNSDRYYWIKTLEGGHVVTPGDWIATGVKGEHWPIKPDVFAATYEAVDDNKAEPTPDAGLAEPAAWMFELARAIRPDKTYTDWGPPQLSFTKPCVPAGSIRNLTALRPITSVSEEVVEAAVLSALHAEPKLSCDDRVRIIRAVLTALKEASPLPPTAAAAALAVRVQQAHEWGYRDCAEGGFVEDNSPFDLANAVLSTSTAPATALPDWTTLDECLNVAKHATHVLQTTGDTEEGVTLAFTSLSVFIEKYRDRAARQPMSMRSAEWELEAEAAPAIDRDSVLEEAARYHERLANKAEASWRRARRNGLEFAHGGQRDAEQHRFHATAIRALRHDNGGQP